jgi:protein involved in polysaccharide export with SLBB domain
VEPIGQVYIAAATAREELLLENGDVLKVPKRDGLVLISGEVLFPNAVAYDEDAVLSDYINRAGGYSQNADVSRVVIARNDGSFEGVKSKWGWFRSGPRDVSLRSGDEVLVLPKIDVKSRQVAKDLSQILYQIAVTAKVVSDF